MLLVMFMCHVYMPWKQEQTMYMETSLQILNIINYFFLYIYSQKIYNITILYYLISQT